MWARWGVRDTLIGFYTVPAGRFGHSSPHQQGGEGQVLRIWNGRVRAQGAGCGVQGAGCGVRGAGRRVQGAGRRVQGAGCRVQGEWTACWLVG